MFIEGAKFEIKRKSRCLQKSKRFDWGTKHADRAKHVDRSDLPPLLLPPGASPESTSSTGWATELKI